MHHRELQANKLHVKSIKTKISHMDNVLAKQNRGIIPGWKFGKLYYILSCICGW